MTAQPGPRVLNFATGQLGFAQQIGWFSTLRWFGRKSKLQAMGDTTLLCPVYGCETEGGVLFTKPSATTLGEHNAQFQTCPVSAKEFCSAVTKATVQLTLHRRLEYSAA